MRELSLHILDAIQNSLEAGATLVDVRIEENLTTDRLTITIQDNGRGMDEAQLARVFDPFYTTRKTRHVGLGIPLFKAAATRCNGDLAITSEVGRGTALRATFQHSHIDRASLGDITGTLMAVILGGPGDLRYLHRVTRWQGNKETRKQGNKEIRELRDERVKEFEFNTAEIKAELGDAPLTHPAVRAWLRDFIAAGEATLSEASI